MKGDDISTTTRVAPLDFPTVAIIPSPMNAFDDLGRGTNSAQQMGMK